MDKAGSRVLGLNSSGLRYVPPKTRLSSEFPTFSPNALPSRTGIVKRRKSIPEMILRNFMPQI
jgi:hypothetical protein